MPGGVVAVVVLVGCGRAAGSWSEGVLVLETQQPCWWYVRHCGYFCAEQRRAWCSNTIG